MKPLPTAEAFVSTRGQHYISTQTKGIYKMVGPDELIEFAQIHVQAALEAAAENVKGQEFFHGRVLAVDKDSIINAYPLTNIK